MSMTLEQHLLLKLSEEASEISQITSKAIQFGLLNKEPSSGMFNIDRIKEELNDLLGVVELLNNTISFGFKPDALAIDKKGIKVMKYLEESKRLGRVNDEV